MFKVGDVVTLKSGGPSMTVECDLGLTVQAIWFDDKSKCTSRAFSVESLKFVEEQSEPEDENI